MAGDAAKKAAVRSRAALKLYGGIGAAAFAFFVAGRW
jgi:hypothetical protein